jgi:hypothetical protein
MQVMQQKKELHHINKVCDVVSMMVKDNAKNLMPHTILTTIITFQYQTLVC